MNSTQLQRWLRRQGCTINDKSGTGHKVAVLGKKHAVIPVHGGSREIPNGTVRAIIRQLGIKLDGRLPR